MSIIRKEINMIKATINKDETLRNAFAKNNAKKIGGALCETKPALRGIVLQGYKVLATNVCVDKEIKHDLNNVIMFKKQKEVA